MPPCVRFHTVLSCLVVAVAAAACVSPRVPIRCAAQPQSGSHGDDDRGHFGDRVLLTASAIPAAWLTRDLDGVADDGEETTSSGFGLRAALGNRDQSIGVLWQSLQGDDDALDVEAVGLDVDVRTPLTDGTGLFWLRAGATVGGAWLDLPGDGSSDFQADAQLRLGVDCQPTHFFVAGASIGGVVFGHPGETEAYGAIFTVDIGVVF